MMNCELRIKNGLRSAERSILNSQFLILNSLLVLLFATTASAQVNWLPWSDAAFEKARQENKPVFLSIGFSTCHWCHVMDRESFNDPEVAKLLNEGFVPVKVDREQRPDVDAIYVAVSRAMTGEAGWPLNVVLTPDRKPFFTGSYIPKDDRPGRAGMLTLLPRLAALWRDKRELATSQAEMIVQSLQAPVSGPALDEKTLAEGYRQLASRFDAKHGGFLPAPKFAAPHQLLFLLRYWKRSGDVKALAMVEKTLRAIRIAPVFDSVDFGVHRYATNADWSEPHYEKMLHDQALLAMAYVEAFQATRDPLYRETARHIFTYVLRDLRAPNGAFYSAEDADEAYYTASRRTKARRPKRDEKILTDWNGLMIAALAQASVALDEPAYAEAAKRAATAILAGGKLMHYQQIPPFLDDYAYVVWGLLNLYEATFDERWLQQAVALEGEALQRFRDAGGAFYLTASDAESLIVRPRELQDLALPSGNSVQLMNLVRLSRITANPEYDEAAQKLLRVEITPASSTHLLSALDFALGPSYEVVLAGPLSKEMRRAVFTPYVPNKVVLRPNALAPYTEAQKPIDGKATAYVCRNYVCRLPTNDPGKVWPVAVR